MHTLILGLALSLAPLAAPAAPAKTPPTYKLGVVVVVDQFRADYLMRMQFKGGLKFLKEGGAYFPLADHGLLQNMTGPGHAAVLSGTYPYRHGISTNYWYNREKKSVEYCTQDDTQKIIGSQGPVAGLVGISPKNFNGTTLGDELKNVDRASKVVSIAAKDRAAVLMGGKRADHAYWYNEKACGWVTSSFYRNDLPAFVKKQNDQITASKGRKFSWGPYKDILPCSREITQTPWAIDQTVQLAIAALDDQKLGQGTDTDLLLVSFSAHDYLGHKFGPNSEHLADMSADEDVQIQKLIDAVAKRVPGGLKNVFFVLTGDHGTPPSPGALPKERLPNGNIPEEEVVGFIENLLNKEYGKAKGTGKWIESIVEFQLYLNQEAMKDQELTPTKVASFLRPHLLQARYIDQLVVRDEVLYERKVPPLDFGRSVDHTLTRQSGDLLMILNPFFWSDTYPVTHMTHYSYDRYVPLVIWGKTFKPGTYRQVVNVVDLAPTLSSVLNVLPPSQSEGRVMTEILR